MLTLTPAPTAGSRVLLALGSDGCDPVFRGVEVTDLSGTFQEAAALVATAEARWQIQPRNPVATKRAGGTATKHMVLVLHPARCVAYFSAKALAGEPDPPTLFSGAAVKSPS